MPTLATELTVRLEHDRPGRLARAAEAIASGGLNLDGFAEVEGILHVLTSKPGSARHALESVGLQVTAERSVVVTDRIEDRAGTAADIFARLAQAGLDIEYTYIASGNRFVIATADPARALEIVGQPSRPR
jgi:hypothetical protein